MAHRPIIAEEGSEGGTQAVILVAIVTAILFALILFFGYGGVKPSGPSAESPATSGAQKP